ncbi:malectin domain-containing carbohydrate-binding protein [Daejeonella oryzae]|uniref:malectin domain-containing carbohydrate-binding protein n=1 Tax=Daejeonella oryzae TaxID=1122943 RepID=UPI0004197148|nr:malectin domain-containing carbohydrate-binding protein [Daejeonella oryzae]
MKIRNHSATKLLLGVCLTSSILLFSQCKKEEPLQLEQTAVTENLIESSEYPGEDLIAATTAPTGAYNIQNALPSGYVKDGSRDYTVYIQNALDKYSEIAFPGFPILVNDLGLRIGSNKRITFLNGSEIRLKGTSKSSYNILDIRGASNVTLVDPVVVGDRNSHSGTSGESGVGIGIRGSSNVVLTNAKVTNCWGDGIYLGVHNGIGTKNISINGGSARNNRRDGVSIISVDGLKVDNFYAGFNAGTSPQCGINFEPNSPKDDLKNIVFNNLTTEGQPGYGIQLGLTNMYGAGNKYIDITMNNHVDKQSKKAMKFSSYTSKRAGSEVISANVVYNNASWKQHPLTPTDIMAIALFEPAQKITLKNPEVITAAGVTLSETKTISLLSRLFNKTANRLLTFTDEPTTTNTNTAPEPTPEPEPAPAPTASSNSVVFAVNAGGSEFTASNGIKYLSDRNFSGGKTYSTSSSITNTSDDVLYQKERYGNFSYNIPLADGTYEVTLKLAETVYSATGKRRFDVLFEGSEQVSNIDLYAVAGKNKANDIVKTIQVTDGTLNIQFKTDVNYSSLKALHVIKK